MNVGYIIVGQKSVECEFDVWVLVFFGVKSSTSGDGSLFFAESGRRIEYRTAASAYRDILRIGSKRHRVGSFQSETADGTFQRNILCYGFAARFHLDILQGIRHIAYDIVGKGHFIP